MRKEHLKEIQKYMEEFKTVKITPLPFRRSKFLKVKSAKYRLNNGKEIIREKIVKNNKDGSAVIIVPVTKENQMVIAVEPRVNTKETVGIGFPAGYIEKNESVVEAAKRELQEETGYQAEEFTELGHGFYQDEGCYSAYNHIVLATGCVKVSNQMLDKDEFIHYSLCTIAEAYEMLDNGIIKGGNSQLALLNAKELLKRK